MYHDTSPKTPPWQALGRPEGQLSICGTMSRCVPYYSRPCAVTQGQSIQVEFYGAPAGLWP